ncbi:hypothetical protein [Weissella viridescens]|uniref:hypothetical protein n=1 Tax=Weissella viridescens TaxID=1629 RepID=UPI003529D3AD
MFIYKVIAMMFSCYLIYVFFNKYFIEYKKKRVHEFKNKTKNFNNTTKNFNNTTKKFSEVINAGEQSNDFGGKINEIKEPTYRYIQKIRNFSVKINNYNQEISNFEKEINNVEKEINNVKQKIRIFSMAIYTFAVEISTFLEENSPFEKEIKAFEKEIKAFEKEIKAFEKEIKAFEKEINTFSDTTAKKVKHHVYLSVILLASYYFVLISFLYYAKSYDNDFSFGLLSFIAPLIILLCQGSISWLIDWLTKNVLATYSSNFNWISYLLNPLLSFFAVYILLFMMIPTNISKNESLLSNVSLFIKSGFQGINGMGLFYIALISIGAIILITVVPGRLIEAMLGPKPNPETEENATTYTITKTKGSDVEKITLESESTPKIQPDQKKEKTESTQKISIAKGSTIGMVERFLLVIAVFNIDMFTPIFAGIIALKTLTRFEKINKEPKYAEYYLFGSLVSLLTGLVIAFIIYYSCSTLFGYTPNLSKSK